MDVGRAMDWMGGKVWIGGRGPEAVAPRRRAILRLAGLWAPTALWAPAALRAAPAGPATAATPATPAPTATPVARPLVQVWKDPACGCCQDWMDHLWRAGFELRVVEHGQASARARLGLPERYASCHTALVDGYVVEGHVPAADLHRLLRQRPKALGLAVPGMPIGSPGMDGPAYRGRREPYQVLLVAHDGTARVFARHP